jgi:hypothetical protein
MADPALSAHLRAGYKVRRILLDFLWDDSSLNAFYAAGDGQPELPARKTQDRVRPRCSGLLRRIRVRAAQWLMRPIHSWEEFEQTVNFFVDTANTYHSHFPPFPSCSLPSFSRSCPMDLTRAAAIRRLASMTDRYLDLFSELAEKHGLYIIAGSQPELREGDVTTSPIFSPRARQHYSQDALHSADRTDRF